MLFAIRTINRYSPKATAKARRVVPVAALFYRRNRRNLDTSRSDGFATSPYTLPSPSGEPINVDHLFRPSTMAAKPKQQGKLIFDMCDDERNIRREVTDNNINITVCSTRLLVQSSIGLLFLKSTQFTLPMSV